MDETASTFILESRVIMLHQIKTLNLKVQRHTDEEKYLFGKQLGMHIMNYIHGVQLSYDDLEEPNQRRLLNKLGVIGTIVNTNRAWARSELSISKDDDYRAYVMSDFATSINELANQTVVVWENLYSSLNVDSD